MMKNTDLIFLDGQLSQSVASNYFFSAPLYKATAVLNGFKLFGLHLNRRFCFLQVGLFTEIGPMSCFISRHVSQF